MQLQPNGQPRPHQRDRAACCSHPSSARPPLKRVMLAALARGATKRARQGAGGRRGGASSPLAIRHWLRAPGVLTAAPLLVADELQSQSVVRLCVNASRGGEGAAPTSRVGSRRVSPRDVTGVGAGSHGSTAGLWTCRGPPPASLAGPPRRRARRQHAATRILMYGSAVTTFLTAQFAVNEHIENAYRSTVGNNGSYMWVHGCGGWGARLLGQAAAIQVSYACGLVHQALLAARQLNRPLSSSISWAITPACSRWGEPLRSACA